VDSGRVPVAPSLLPPNTLRAKGAVLVSRFKTINILAVALFVVILGLCAAYVLLSSHVDTANITGTMLYNNTPDSHYKAIITFNDGKTMIALPDTNGDYLSNVQLSTVKKISITYDGQTIVEYGPPFHENVDYGVNHNHQEDTV